MYRRDFSKFWICVAKFTLKNPRRIFMHLSEHIEWAFLFVSTIIKYWIFLKINAHDCSHDGSLSVENVLWANTVLASGMKFEMLLFQFEWFFIGTAIGIVVSVHCASIKILIFSLIWTDKKVQKITYFF